MGKPLFTPEELAAYRRKHSNLQARERSKELQWPAYWAEKEALEKSHLAEKASRAKARLPDYLRGLVILTGKRGQEYVTFDALFQHSDDQELQSMFTGANTPENRRALHTILKALQVIPRSWARSAFVRFLRGIGKQRGSKLYGAGLFGVNFGWTEPQVIAVCNVLVDDRNPYSQVLMSFVDVQQELAEAAESDSEVVDSDVSFKATRVNRDTEFLGQLVAALEAEGLAPLPEAKEHKPTKQRKPKVFKPGDIIRESNLRDLPLPAHVEIPIERRAEGSQDWAPGTIEQVVTTLHPGYVTCYRIKDGRAYVRGWNEQRKDWLSGATYLGPWTGEMVKGKDVKYKFEFRKPQQK